MRHVAPAVHIVPYAVVDLAATAVDQWQVGEISAILALVSVFEHLVSLFHQRHRFVTLWKLSGVLHWHSCLHFRLHEGSLPHFKVQVLIEFGLEDGSGGGININFLDVSDVLCDNPLNWENRYLFAGASVELLAFGPKFKPVTRRKIDCFTYIQTSGEAWVVGSGQSQNVLTWALKCLVDFNSLLL